MARGYCKKCNVLQILIPGKQKTPGFSAQQQWPVPHKDANGKDCEGSEWPI